MANSHVELPSTTVRTGNDSSPSQPTRTISCREDKTSPSLSTRSLAKTERDNSWFELFTLSQDASLQKLLGILVSWIQSLQAQGASVLQPKLSYLELVKRTRTNALQVSISLLDHVFNFTPATVQGPGLQHVLHTLNEPKENNSAEECFLLEQQIWELLLKEKNTNAVELFETLCKYSSRINAQRFLEYYLGIAKSSQEQMTLMKCYQFALTQENFHMPFELERKIWQCFFSGTSTEKEKKSIGEKIFRKISSKEIGRILQFVENWIGGFVSPHVMLTVEKKLLSSMRVQKYQTKINRITEAKILALKLFPVDQKSQKKSERSEEAIKSRLQKSRVKFFSRADVSSYKIYNMPVEQAAEVYKKKLVVVEELINKKLHKENHEQPEFHFTKLTP